MKNSTTMAITFKANKDLRDMKEIIDKKGLIDGHTNKPAVFHGLIMLMSGEVCPAFKGTHQCTNPIFINKDGIPTISKASVAGPTWKWDSRLGMEASIEAANQHIVDDFQEGRLNFCQPIIGWLEF